MPENESVQYNKGDNYHKKHKPLCLLWQVPLRKQPHLESQKI